MAEGHFGVAQTVEKEVALALAERQELEAGRRPRLPSSAEQLAWAAEVPERLERAAEVVQLVLKP